MMRLTVGLVGFLAAVSVQADNLTGIDRIVCAASQVQICIEFDSCYAATPTEVDVPDFVVIDIGKKSISTTRASAENRSTSFSTIVRQSGRIYLQGVEGGRAFSFVIDEATGRITVAVSRDGLSVSVFGACTDANL